MNLFEMIYPRFYFDKSKPIRMFEAFSGVGCHAKCEAYKNWKLEAKKLQDEKRQKEYYERLGRKD